ncbi:phosphoglycerol transferase [Clostridia bacterium]|nr:phosphoglycerol transferase [Clostridia bacterium]
MEKIKSALSFLKAEILKIREILWVKIAVWAVFTVTPMLLVFVLEWFNRPSLMEVRKFFSLSPKIFAFHVLIVYVLFAAVFFIAKKMWITVLICGTFTVLLSVANYLKFALTGANLYPWDLMLAGNVGEITGFVTIPIPFKGWILIIFIILLVLLFVAVGRDLPLRFFFRLPIGTAIFAAVILTFGNADFAMKIFNRFDLYYEAVALLESGYVESGFVGAFSLNVASASVAKPVGYTKDAVSAALSKYAEIPPSEDFLSPDIIVILSESFWDPRLLPSSTFSENPLANYDELSERENTVSGGIFVPALGGGTIRTEFEVLTGLSVDALPSGVIPYNIIKSGIPSYVRRYKALGYDTIALHTFQARFYNRLKTLPHLGFDEYHGIEELEKLTEVQHTTAGAHTSDYSFEKYIEYYLDRADAPIFLFGISMESHSPYRDKYAELDITMGNPALTAADLNTMQNYVQGIKDADAALGMLAEYIDNRERPTILVWFGDHLPSVGVNSSVWLDTGFVETTWAAADREKLYSTPFIIHANFKLENGMFTEATDNRISTYNLLNELSLLVGSGQSAYMAHLSALYDILPYYNIRAGVELTEKQKELLSVQYYKTYEEIVK